MLKAVHKQLNRKVYDRGVHKGERIDQGDYFWPDWFRPETRGLEHVAAGVRQSPMGTATEKIMTNDGKALPQDNATMVVMDPRRREQLQGLRPRWK